MFNDTIGLIDKGRKGNAPWIPLPFPKLSQHVGITRAVYTIIGGGSGTGKTGFADRAYVLHPYEWVRQNPEKGIKLKIFAWKLERPKSHTVAKWICFKLWEDYGIVMDVPTLLAWGDKRSALTEEVYQKICSLRDYFEEMAETVEIIDVRENPTGIYNTLRAWARANGKEFDKEGQEITDQRLQEAHNRKETIAVWSYVPNDPSLITIALEDHYGIVKDERGFNKKENIDKLSDYNQICRDRYGHSPVGVIQFNRNIRDVQRRTNLLLQPEDADFEHTSRPYQDCDVALGILNPYKFNLKEYLGYKVPQFVSETGTNRFRSVSVMKNSYGTDDIHMGSHFIGEFGGFYELPHPEEMGPDDYYRYANLRARERPDYFGGDVEFG